MNSIAETRMQESSAVSEEITTLAVALRGEVLTPDKPGYDQARIVWNGAIDKRPAVIARCAGVADVIDAVNFARRTSCRSPCAVAPTTWPAMPSAMTASSSIWGL